MRLEAGPEPEATRPAPAVRSSRWRDEGMQAAPHQARENSDQRCKRARLGGCSRGQRRLFGDKQPSTSRGLGRAGGPV